METEKTIQQSYVRLSVRSNKRGQRERPRCEAGLFQSAYALRDGAGTSYMDEDRLRALLKWTNKNLGAPNNLDSVHAIF